ncbi:unnamed protein product [Larinioides sclopetarius]|uniref:Uncharacterized protein n=1 Tax=Larinioides sclopetarius TaxID=280406 RepID=A0AAV2AVW2_9ARAC
MDALLWLCAGLKSIYVSGKSFIDAFENVSGTSVNEILKYVIETVVFAGVIIKGILFSLSLIGFGAVGITAGSIAACFQSMWFGGTIAGITGWLFSALQSIGAAGLGTAGMAIITFFSGIFATLYECIF